MLVMSMTPELPEEDIIAPTVSTFSTWAARRSTSSARDTACSRVQPSGMETVRFTVFMSILGMKAKPRARVAPAEPSSSTSDSSSTTALCLRDQDTALR